MPVPQPLTLEDATADTRWVEARPLVVAFELAPDPTERVRYRVHVTVQQLDGSDRRVLTPHNAMWAQLSPDGARLASISFDDLSLIITDVATGAQRTAVAHVMPKRSPTLKTDLPPTFQWSPDGTSILVQSPEVDGDGDGQLEHATMRLWELASGTLVREFARPQMGPFLFLRTGAGIAVPSLQREGQMVVIDLATLAETSVPVDGDALHVNQTPSLVLHDTAIAPDGTVLHAQRSQLSLGGRTVVTATKTQLVAPAWTDDGRYAVFAAAGKLYVYDPAAHRLGVLGPGAPSPLIVRTDYRPSAARLQSPFDLAYRTF